MTEFHFSVCYNYMLLSTQMPSVALYQAAPTSLTTDCNAVFLCCFFSPINLTLMSALDYRISLSME